MTSCILNRKATRLNSIPILFIILITKNMQCLDSHAHSPIGHQPVEVRTHFTPRDVGERESCQRSKCLVALQHVYTEQSRANRGEHVDVGRVVDVASVGPGWENGRVAHAAYNTEVREVKLLAYGDEAAVDGQ
ncbi:hypothetical protein BM1_06263 [Bipolaris maydis]|nr:hypothetical protein BM1_06263 [Bipolaris maydis]